MKKTENIFNILIPTESSSCDEMNIIFRTPVAVQITQTIVPESFTKISNEMIEKYINNIQNAIKSSIYEESSLGLAAYIENKKLREGIKVIVVSVEEYNNNLYGVASIIPKRHLTDKEIDCIKDYLEGQYADGWGESFEQQYIQVKEGKINISFWDSKNFYIKSEKELKGNTVQIDETQEIRLYSPLNILFSDESVNCINSYTAIKKRIKLDSSDLLSYMDIINNSIYKINKDIMIFLSDNYKNLSDKIKHIEVTLKYLPCNLCDLYAVTKIELKEKLSNSEINMLKFCLLKKYSSIEKNVNIKFYNKREQLIIDFNNKGKLFMD